MVTAPVRESSMQVGNLNGIYFYANKLFLVSPEEEAIYVIKLVNTSWGLNDLLRNAITSNVALTSAMEIYTAFNADAEFDNCPPHAQQFITKLTTPLTLQQSVRESPLKMEIAALFQTFHKQVSEMFVFSDKNADFDQDRSRLLLALSVTGLLGGAAPLKDYLSEAAIDAVHVARLIDNFVEISEHLIYNKNAVSNFPSYFQIDNTKYRHGMKPDIELRLPNGMGIFFLEHKTVHKKGEYGPYRIKVAWELLTSFYVIYGFPFCTLICI